MIDLLQELKNSCFNIEAFTRMKMSQQKKENQKFAGLLDITKNRQFSSVLHAHSQFLCSLARFNLANLGVRQSDQSHTFYTRLLLFDKTSAKLHFTVVNSYDAVMSVF